MKATGIVRKLDHLGRVVLPRELRRTMGLNEGTPIEIFTQGDMIIIKKYRPNSESVLLAALQAACKEVGKDPEAYLEAAREAKS